jgi:hypothetical protein
MSAIAAGLEKLWRAPAAQKTYCRIADDHVLDPGYTGRVFERDQAYFTISLAEMFLANARQLWQGLAPLTVAVADFQYAGERESAPFVVGKDLLANVQNYLNGENVEYRNTRIFGPAPYAGGPVGLFVGLFQTAANSPTTEFFGILSDIADAFKLAGLSGYLPVAKVVTSGLARLLGLDGTHLRIGARDEFTSGADQPNQFREGYLAYVNCPPDGLGEPVWAKDGLLLSGRTADSARALTRHDHCLVRVLWNAERDDYTSLPFHKLWEKTRNLIWEAQEEKARGSFLELAQQVAGSPDLTTRHRVGLLSVYRANFESELDLHRATTGVVERTPNTRGAGRGAASAKAALQGDALASRRAGFGNEVETALLGLANGWPRLKQIRGDQPILTDDVVNEQMRAIGASPVDPRHLADALVVAAFQKSV